MKKTKLWKVKLRLDIDLTLYLQGDLVIRLCLYWTMRLICFLPKTLIWDWVQWVRLKARSQPKYVSNGLIMWIGHRKEIRKLTFRTLVLRWSESSISPLFDSLRQRANAWNVSFRISLRWPIHIINPFDTIFRLASGFEPDPLYSISNQGFRQETNLIELSLEA